MDIKFLLDFQKHLRADVVNNVDSQEVLIGEVNEFAALRITPDMSRPGCEFMGFYHGVRGLIVHRITQTMCLLYMRKPFTQETDWVVMSINLALDELLNGSANPCA
jgi:hypothetical protein